MNINSVSQFSIKANSVKTAPAFGLAKLNEVGRTSADSFGYQNNDFLNPRMFEKQGIFHNSELANELEDGERFEDICTIYGCSNNPVTNAAFIENQILVSKSRSAISKVDRDARREGLLKLYMHNYDNPKLSLKATKQLLEEVRVGLQDEEYVKHVGILEAGTDKKAKY